MSFGFSRVRVRFALALSIIAFVWTAVPFQSVAQKVSEEDLEKQIQTEVGHQDWAEVLNLARTQIWMDVDRASGYYYSALAHVALGNPKMAKPFLVEARRLDKGDLHAEIHALEQSIWKKRRKADERGFMEIRSLDRFYYALTYSPEMPIGFHLGSLNTHGIGTYFLIRSNQAFLQQKADFTVNNSGTAYGSPYAKTVPTGQVKIGMAELLMGLTWKVVGPVWMYGGIGLNHSREYREMETQDENSNSMGVVWARNQQSNLNQHTVETGLLADFKGINIRLGSSLTNFEWENIRYHIGLGFSFRKK